MKISSCNCGAASSRPKNAEATPGEWSRQLTNWISDPPVSDPEGDVYLAGYHHSAYKLDGTTGELEWQTDLGHTLSDPKVMGDTVLFRSHWVADSKPGQGLPEITSLNESLAVDRSTGELKWSFRHGESSQGFTQLGDNLVGVSHQQQLQAIDPATGEVVWTREEALDPYSFDLTVAEGRLYLNSRAYGPATLESVDPASGKTFWAFTGAGVKPLPGPDGSLVAHCSKFDENVHYQQFYGLEPDNGTVLWKLSTQDERVAFGRDSDGQILLQRSQSWEDPFHTLERRDRHTGELLWSKQLPPLAEVGNGPHGEILAHSVKWNDQGRYGPTLMSLDRETGVKNWSLGFADDAEVRVILAEKGKLVLSQSQVDDEGNEQASLVSVNPESGEVAWSYPLGKQSWKAYLSEDGNSLSVNVSGCKLLTLDAHTGEPRWNVPAERLMNPEISSSGAQMLTSDFEGRIQSLNIADSKMADPGDPGPLPGDDANSGPTVLSGASSFPMLETRRKVAGRQREVLMAEIDWNGRPDNWDYLVVRDGDGDGALTPADLETMPTLADLRQHDSNGDGHLNGSEVEQAALHLWRDSDGDGLLSQEDFLFELQEDGQLGWVDLDRKVVAQAFVRSCSN